MRQSPNRCGASGIPRRREGLSPYEMPFCMGLAGELPPAWPGFVSACAFLDRFSHFYRGNRTRIELGGASCATLPRDSWLFRIGRRSSQW